MQQDWQKTVTVKLKIFPTDFNKRLCTEKPQVNQSGLGLFQKMSKSKGSFTTGNIQSMEDQSLVSELRESFHFGTIKMH